MTSMGEGDNISILRGVQKMDDTTKEDTLILDDFGKLTDLFGYFSYHFCKIIDYCREKGISTEEISLEELEQLRVYEHA